MKNTMLFEDVISTEIVINTTEVQYRIFNGDIHAMLIGGHKFEISLDTLADLNKAVSITNQNQ